MPRLAMLVIVFLVGLAPLLAADGMAAKPKRDKPHRDRAPMELETGLLPAAVQAQGSGERFSVKNRYIVVLKDGVANPLRVAERLAADGGVVPTHVYRHVFTGFAAEIAPDQLAAVKRDPNVVSVTRDRIVAFPDEPRTRAPARAGVAAEADELTPNIDRIDADQSHVAAIDGVDTRVDVDVAILDTGIAPHLDLNIYAQADCVGTGHADTWGHGTMVAGVVGALDNGTGVVGVAPGARLWAVKVSDAWLGGATEATVICGLDLVTAHAPGTGQPVGDVEVANLSFAVDVGHTPDGDCGSTADSEHQAVCRAIDAGVTVVTAAGNSSKDASKFFPAHFLEPITVSALGDSDGKPGGKGANTTWGRDDTFASFSNFGGPIDLAAPGVDIISTGHRDSNYYIESGTSFAAPHVAGAAALYIAEHGKVGPEAVRNGLLDQRERFDMPGDPDGIAEGIVRLPDTMPPTVKIVAPKGGATLKTGPTIKLTAKDSGSGVKSVVVRVCKGPTCDFAAGTPLGTDATAPYAVKWTWGKQLPKNGTYTLVARATDKVGNTKTSDPVTIRIKRK